MDTTTGTRSRVIQADSPEIDDATREYMASLGIDSLQSDPVIDRGWTTVVPPIDNSPLIPPSGPDYSPNRANEPMPWETAGVETFVPPEVNPPYGTDGLPTVVTPTVGPVVAVPTNEGWEAAPQPNSTIFGWTPPWTPADRSDQYASDGGAFFRIGEGIFDNAVPFVQDPVGTVAGPVGGAVGGAFEGIGEMMGGMMSFMMVMLLLDTMRDRR